jgi:hypothetical protein
MTEEAAMPEMALPVITADMTVFGKDPSRMVVRVPRSLRSKLTVGAHVLVADDSVEPARFIVTELLNDGRDVRLDAV